MRHTLFLLAALSGLLFASGAVNAEDSTAEPAAAAEAQPAVFSVYDHVVLHMEFDDDDMDALQEIGAIVEQVLKEAKLPENSEPWAENPHFILSADSKVVEPPLTAALTIKPYSESDVSENQQAPQTFYYDPAELVKFTSALRIYFRDTLKLVFEEEAPEAPTSVSEMVELQLRGTQKEMKVLHKMAELVKSVLQDAEPTQDAYDKEGKLRERQLELRLNVEVAEPPFEALFALENVDVADEAQRQTQVFAYNPQTLQLMLDELQTYLVKVLYVRFPSAREAQPADTGEATENMDL